MKCRGLKQQSCIRSQFYRDGTRHSTAGFSARGLTRLQSRCSPSWALTWRFWGRINLQPMSSCWRNSAPSGWRTEVPVSLLAIGQQASFNTFGHFLSHVALSVFKPTMTYQVLLILAIFLPRSAALKGRCDYIRSAWIFQGRPTSFKVN